MRSRWYFVLVLLVIGFIGFLFDMGACRAESIPPAVGSVLPEFVLPVSGSLEENVYLGVAHKDFFRLHEVESDIVILEIFNMYCPHCQREAPNVNQLYEMISGRDDGQARIKMLGVGVGNSPFEVRTFKKTFKVPFPLFPDSDFSIHNTLGRVRTPYFIVIKINRDGTPTVIYSRVGSIGEPEEFLQHILEQSRMK